MPSAGAEERFAVACCTREDFYEILETQAEFWDGRDMRHLFHPFLLHQFGNSAYVIRDGSHVEGGHVVAYLFGLLSQTEPVAYAHAMSGAGEQLAKWWRRNPHIPLGDIVQYHFDMVWTGLQQVAEG